MDPDQIARAFVDHYYTIFDTNRPGLVTLYQDGSMLTFEGQKVAGAQGIVGKLTGLAFQQCKHHVTTIDAQLSGPGGGMLVFVSGNMQLPGEDHALKFSQPHTARNAYHEQSPVEAYGRSHIRGWKKVVKLCLKQF